MKSFITAPIALAFIAAAVSAKTLAQNGTIQQIEDISFEIPRPECSLPDSITVKERMSLELPFSPIWTISADSYAENSVVNGLSTLKLKVAIKVQELKAEFELSIGQMDQSGTYKADGHLDLSPIPAETVQSGDFSGEGQAKIDIENLSVKGSGTIGITEGGIELATLTFSELKFDKLNLDLENYEIAGKKVDWTKFNAANKANWDKEWATHGAAVTERIRVAINELIKDIPPTQLQASLQQAVPCLTFPPELINTTEGSGANSIFTTSGYLMAVLTALFTLRF